MSRKILATLFFRESKRSLSTLNLIRNEQIVSIRRQTRTPVNSQLKVRTFGAITSTNYDVSKESTSNEIDDKGQILPLVHFSDLLAVQTSDEASNLLSKWLADIKHGVLNPESIQHKLLLSPLEAIEFLQSDRISFQPEPEIYLLLLQGALWKRWDEEFPPKKCAKMLDRFLKALMNEAPTIDDKRSLLKLVHKVMTSWVRAKKVSHAEQWLKVLEEPQSPMSPTSLTYSIVINAWVRNQVPQKAEATLYRMISRKQTDQDIVITKTYFHRCLDAWVHSKDKAAGERSEVLLLKMQDENTGKGLEGGGPCPHSWFKVVCAWTNSNKSQREAAPRAQRILNLLLESEDIDWENTENTKWLIETYIQVMRAWSFHGGNVGFERVRALLQDLFTKVKAEHVTTLTGNVSNRIFLHWMTALVKSEYEDLPGQLKVVLQEMTDRNLDIDWNTASFNLVLNVYAKAKDGHEAENILKKMLQLVLDGKDDCRPDRQTFNSVILAWSKSYDRAAASMRAEEIFTLMKRVEGVTPNVATYNALLSALGGSTDLETARRGEGYLEELKRAYADTKSPSYRPSNVTYTKAILLWSNIPSPGPEALDHAESLLQELLAKGSSDDNLAPTVATYKAFQSVLMNSDAPDKRERLQEIHIAIQSLR